MNIQIDIAKDLFSQFASQLNAEQTLNTLMIDPKIGIGTINIISLPNSLEFYHFKFKLNKEVAFNSFNHKDSDYFLLNVNLSDNVVSKRVNGQNVVIQKHLPAGVLYYPPNVNVFSKSPLHKQFEIVLIKFHKSLPATYFPLGEDSFLTIKDTIIYEDLDFKSEELLQQIINGTNMIESHAKLLAFLSLFFEKLKQRETGLNYENLHPQDLKHLFLAASLLRNPLITVVPTLDELAQVAKMGKTKFKNGFRQVFGNAPRQYHQKIRMEYAKDEIQMRHRTATDLAYELGYAHPSKFTRAFKKHFGHTPSQS